MGLHGETSQIEPGIIVVRVSGKLTFEETDTITSLIQGLLDRGEKKLILELRGISGIDSVGGTALIRCYFAAREADASLCVARASHAVKELFHSTRVDTLVPFFSTMSAAQEHFGGTSGVQKGNA